MSRLRTPMTPQKRRFAPVVPTVGVGAPGGNPINTTITEALKRYLQHGGGKPVNSVPGRPSQGQVIRQLFGGGAQAPATVPGGGSLGAGDSGLQDAVNQAKSLGIGTGSPVSSVARSIRARHGSQVPPETIDSLAGPYLEGLRKQQAIDAQISGAAPPIPPDPNASPVPPSGPMSTLRKLMILRDGAERKIKANQMRPGQVAIPPEASPETIAAEARGLTLRSGGAVAPDTTGGRMDHAQAIDATGGRTPEGFLADSHRFGQSLMRAQQQSDSRLTSPLGRYPTTQVPSAQPQRELPAGFASSPNEFRHRARINAAARPSYNAQDSQNLENSFLGLPAVGRSRRSPEQVAQTNANQQAMATRLQAKGGAPERQNGELAADYIHRYRKEVVLPKLAAAAAKHKNARAIQGARILSRRKNISMSEAMRQVGARYPGSTRPPGPAKPNDTYDPNAPVSQQELDKSKSYLASTAESPLVKRYGLNTENIYRVNRKLYDGVNSGKITTDNLPLIKQSLIARANAGGFRDESTLGGGSLDTRIADAITKADFAKMNTAQRKKFLKDLKTSFASGKRPQGDFMEHLKKGQLDVFGLGSIPLWNTTSRLP